jgi:thiosulfate reductase cytochrome b subunit
MEVNCFLCHTPNPDNDARLQALAEGRYGDSVTATLLQSGLVSEAAGGGWNWNAEAFDEAGNLKREFITLREPTAANCGTCHGVVHTDIQTPLSLDSLTTDQWTTLTTGQIMSAQKISAGGLNIANKSGLNRSWDIHVERVLACSDCHYSLNNPIYYQETGDEKPSYLAFDPRRIDLSEYLYRPLHQFAKGQSAQGTLANDIDNSLRRCDSCHSLDATHEWLPYKERHTEALACESCHVPEMYAPALQYVDWTVLTADGEPVRAYRGMEGDTLNAATLITPYEPVLLPRTTTGGSSQLAPFNLISSWYWVHGDPPQPVPLRVLKAAYFAEDGSYHPDILAAFDTDGDGALTAAELNITTDAQTAAVAGRLAAAGLASPRILGEVQPFGISHNVTAGDFVTKDCRTCHGDDSRLAATVELSDRTPGGVQPTLYEGGPVSWPGGIETGDDGALSFAPSTSEAGLYVLGHDAAEIVDWLGILMVLGVVGGIFVHGGMRFFASRKQAKLHKGEPVETQRVYMYDVYERLWHWLQTAAILLLLFTGLIIHEPDKFGIFSFSYVVQVHNILALLLVINAGLSLFYHLASGEIKQFIPRPKGFFDQAAEQAVYYLRGIFKGEPHPFDKTRDRKLNPLQQLTYVMVLNVLLPLQILTGALMWGAQRWPDAAAIFGGLPGLGPIHTLVAWSFTAFIILHVYLTTTGPTPLAGMQAMMMGWEDVEVHEEHAPDGGHAPEAAAAD